MRYLKRLEMFFILDFQIQSSDSSIDSSRHNYYSFNNLKPKRCGHKRRYIRIYGSVIAEIEVSPLQSHVYAQ